MWTRIAITSSPVAASSQLSTTKVEQEEHQNSKQRQQSQSSKSKNNYRRRSLAQSHQTQPSLWTMVAFAQTLIWLFGVPYICHHYVWDQLFGAIIQSYPQHGLFIAEMVFSVSVSPLFLTSYTLIMIPIYVGNYPCFEQYKIQRDVCWPWRDSSPKVRNDFWKLTIRSLKFTSFNMFILVPILVTIKIYIEQDLLSRDKSCCFSTHNDHWPPFHKNLRDILSLIIIQEFGFTLMHKLMHSYPFLYQYHKVHHEYKQYNITLAAQHNHPVDYIFCLAIPALLAILLIPNAHSISQLQYIMWTLWANLDDHVGYSFPWSPVRWFPGSASTNEHEFHHLCNVGCYSSKLTFPNILLGGHTQYEKYHTKWK